MIDLGCIWTYRFTLDHSSQSCASLAILHGTLTLCWRIWLWFVLKDTDSTRSRTQEKTHQVEVACSKIITSVDWFLTCYQWPVYKKAQLKEENSNMSEFRVLRWFFQICQSEKASFFPHFCPSGMSVFVKKTVWNGNLYFCNDVFVFLIQNLQLFDQNLGKCY